MEYLSIMVLNTCVYSLMCIEHMCTGWFLGLRAKYSGAVMCSLQCALYLMGS